MEKASDGHDSPWAQALGDPDGTMDFLNGVNWVVTQTSPSNANAFTLPDSSFFDGMSEPPSHMQYHNPASLSNNVVAGPTASSDAFPNLVSASQRKSAPDEQAALRQNRLENWSFDTEGNSLPVAGNDGTNDSVDIACKSPSSQRSCPSHCGKPGQGSVCCVDDDCAAGTVCSDEECGDVGNLCHDETCLADISSQAFPEFAGDADAGGFDVFGLSARGHIQKQADEVAAAAALTSFAENPPSLHQTFNTNSRRGSRMSSLDESYFDTFGTSSFHHSPTSSLSHVHGRFFGHTQTSSFPGAYHPNFNGEHGFNPGGRSPGFDASGAIMMSPHAAGSHMFQQQPQQQHQHPQVNADMAYLFTSHVLNYHNTVSDSVDQPRPCFVNNTSLSLPTSCPLPLDLGQPLDASNLQSACGFSIEDPQAFQQHILTQHHGLKHTLPASGPCNLNWSPNDPFTPDSQSNGYWGFANDPALSFNHIQARQVPGSAHSVDNGSVSVPFIPTPALSSSQDGRDGKPRQRRRDTEQRQSFSTYGSESPSRMFRTLPDRTLSLEPATKVTNGTASAENGEVTNDVALDITANNGVADSQNQACQCMWLDDKTDLPCNKWFQCPKALDEHCRVDHVKPMEKREGGFRCRWQMCPRRNKDHFPQKGKLNRHLQVHTGLKPNVCPYCGLAVSAKQALDQHIRLHTNETPYPCPWDGCTQKFKQRSALTMHYRTHTGEKPLLCDICGLSFRESSNLTKHRRTHDSKGMYECTLCQRDFNRLDQLRRHLGSSHKDSPERAQEALKMLKPGARHTAPQVRRNAHQQKKAALKGTLQLQQPQHDPHIHAQAQAQAQILAVARPSSPFDVKPVISHGAMIEGGVG